MCAYITSIGTANPQYKIKQGEVLTFMIKAHGLNAEEAHQLTLLFRATGIQERYSTIKDFQKSESSHFFPDNEQLDPFPTTGQRSAWYKKEALSLSIEAIKQCIDHTISLNDITHLITVSCTGMYAPGLDIDIVNQLQLPPNIERTSINFMGCYAAYNALKVADYICKAKKSNVLVVCTELCSIHFQKDKTKDNFLSNALFGDGSAAVLVQSEPAKEVSLKIESFICDLLPHSKEEMAWDIGNFGFEMKLSEFLPEAIKTGMEPLLTSLRQKTRHEKFDFYAIHPGGRKILTVVEKILGISKTENHFSHEVLRKFGNMSSPTILFVIHEILKTLDREQKDKTLLSFTFGPGLTLESLIASVHIA